MCTCEEMNIGSMRLFSGNLGILDIGVYNENVTLGHKVRQSGAELFFIESKTDENDFLEIKIEITVDLK